MLGLKFKNLAHMTRALEQREGKFWIETGRQMALSLFHEAAEKVPAYGKFLKKKGIRPELIKTISDFESVPTIDKKNYLKVYPLKELCFGGDISKLDVISVSSGSSGDPFFWPRSFVQNQEAILSHELFLTDSFDIDKNRTLFLVSFGMGMWVAGTLTYSCLENLASKYPINVIAPGINTDEILKIISNLGSNYSQIIIAGYPPFVKDVIDQGSQRGINWRKFKMRFLFAAEGFSEKWRDYVHDKVGIKNPYKGSLNIYGTADALILGHETPLSIMIRRMAAKNPRLHEKIFGSASRLATLVQYNPALRFFENINGKLIFTAKSGIPLVRYDIGDDGGIFGFDKMKELLREFNVDILKEAKKSEISIWRLPFLYVLGRRDFTAFLYGVNIYPESIRAALEKPETDNFVSGKFLMMVESDKNLNPRLEINIELKKEYSNNSVLLSRLGNRLKNTIINTLKVHNSEYNRLYEAIGKKAEPTIKLYPYGYEKFFKTGMKQQWTKKI